jgi:hypothetical protein
LASLSGDTVARVHWLGKKRLGVEGTAYYFMRLWELPQEPPFELQTLNKLSTVPRRILGLPAPRDNSDALRLAPLLEDVLQEECYLEARHATNQAGEMVFAIRLSDVRAAVWNTNLSLVLASFTNAAPLAGQSGKAWVFKNRPPPNQLEWARAGDWTLVAVGEGRNALLDEMRARIGNLGAPVPAGTTNWLEALLVPSRSFSVFQPHQSSSADPAEIDLRVGGDGERVVVRANLTFSKPLDITLDQWRIPLGLIRERLASFTAVRGLPRAMAASASWDSTRLGPPPDQLFVWTGNASPLQLYAAGLSSDPGKSVDALRNFLLAEGNSWLTSHGSGHFASAGDSNGATWSGLSMVSPFLKLAQADGRNWIYAGLLKPDTTSTNANTQSFFQNILTKSNLVYYDWEYGQPRMESSLYLAQVLRIVTQHPQLAAESPTEQLLSALAPRVDDSLTTVSLAAPNRLSLERKSTTGLTTLEMNLLAGWFESPDFPLGPSH